MKKKLKVFLLGFSGLLLFVIIAVLIYGSILAVFPGNIKGSPYLEEKVEEGVLTTFREGNIYRHPGAVPLLEVSGDHYEMGLQYGVLLRPEIIDALDAYEKLLRWEAESMGVPYPLMVAMMKYESRKIAGRLPERFREEIRGIADGSGVPVDTIQMVSLVYDVGMALGCTSVLMRGEDDTVIHGRNQDISSYYGEEIALLWVVVRYKADGYHAVTQMDLPLFMGFMTGYNSASLTFSEQTVSISKPNRKGHSLPYLARMILEECDSLSEMYSYMERYPVIGGYGIIWADLNSATGKITELAPGQWSVFEFDESLIWNLNKFDDPELKLLRRPISRISAFNRDREELAEQFPRQAAYTVEDTIAFLRSHIGPAGLDYAQSGTKSSICQPGTSQMVIFDPAGDGFYMSFGFHFAAWENIYHYYEDFSRPPILYLEAYPLDPVLAEVSTAEQKLVDDTERLQLLLELTERYPENAYVHFTAAYHSFQQKQPNLFAFHAAEAFRLEPSLDEYRLYASLAACRDNDIEQAMMLLDELAETGLHPEQELIRLTILEWISESLEPEKAFLYSEEREELLEEYELAGHYEQRLLPQLEALQYD